MSPWRSRPRARYKDGAMDLSSCLARVPDYTEFFTLDKLRARTRRLAFVAPPPEDQRALRARRLHNLLDDARLPDPRLTRQQHHPAVSGTGLVEPARQSLQLHRPPVNGVWRSSAAPASGR
jgi:hypothetical protein